MDKITVLIADDHAIMRMGLIALFESDNQIEVVGEAKNGEIAIKQALKLKPDIVVMDLLMPVVDGIAATKAICDKLPDTKVLVLTTSTVSDDLNRALANGASGVVIKSENYDTFLQAIKDVHAGKRYIPADVAELIAQDPPAKALTERQLAILTSTARGLSNDEIARQFDISKAMVKKYLKATYQKLDAANRSEAIAIAQRKHLLKS